MKLFTKDIRDTLLENGRRQDKVRGMEGEIDFSPAVKLFTPDGACTWLLTELDPEDPDIAFGLCDLGMGCPELGSVRVSELESVRGGHYAPETPEACGRAGSRGYAASNQSRLPIERDLYFDPDYPLSVYADAARKAGAITTDRNVLARAAGRDDRRLDPAYQRAVDEFVQREVIHCVSHLVSEVAGKDEEFFHMFRTFDYERAREMVDEALADDPERRAELEEDGLTLDDPDDLRQVFDTLNLDLSDAEAEVYEHWIVSGWLGGKLEAKGEMIERDFYGLTVWGRCCTGQAIALDSVICSIYDETR